MKPWRPRRQAPPAAPRPSTPQAEPPPERTLFILGAARSGTTVLQNALNHSPDIFLLGEPDLYGDGAPGFRARYNAMHAGWGNQPAKSTALPVLTDADGTWRDHLAALARHHRWVGAKLVINPIRAEGELERRLDWHTRWFYPARYVFTFRDPLETAISTRDLQVLGRGATDGLGPILRSQVEVVGLYLRALRLLPHVAAVFHDAAGPDTFEALGRWLGTPLPGAAAYYDRGRVCTYDRSQLDGVADNVLEAVAALHADLRSTAAAGFPTPQLEQNDRHLSPSHYTLLGALDRRARVIAEALR